jgi:hypothetical protein
MPAYDSDVTERSHHKTLEKAGLPSTKALCGAKGISRQETGDTNAGRQVSVWRCAFATSITGH